ncbi:MAG TPA: hypothetical protein ENJ86_05860 [Methylothermaceae bacterium]|nr:hypothetical protein [Methylothermaceae bacterium]
MLTAKQIYIACYLLVFSVSVVTLATQIDWPTSNAYLATGISILKSFNSYLAEVIVAIIIGGLLISRSLFYRIIAYAILFLFFSIYTIQTISYYISGQFITELAIENINHIHLILNGRTITGLIIIFTIFLGIIVLIERKTDRHNQPNNNPNKLTIFTTRIVLVGLATSILLPSQKLIGGTNGESNPPSSSEHIFPTPPPITALALLLAPSQHKEDSSLSTDVLDKVHDYGFHYNPNSVYPLIKHEIYATNPPFPMTKPNSEEPLPNIVVFFTEGFSARNTDIFNSDYKNLTPNLKKFAQHAMVVDNYFNHTAATYRGLHGQICSIYPKYGGVGGWHDNYKNLPKTNYFCLPHLLKLHGYHTYFATSQFRTITFLDEMLAQLGFDRTFMAEDFLFDYLPGEKAIRREGISDQQLFRGLIQLFKRHEHNLDLQPFFIGIYNLETHAFLDVKDDGKRYGDGTNSSLNTIHNLDDAFGKFWNYFIHSPYSENTIIIFTADHAHYHDKPFIRAFAKPTKFKRPYQRIFVDQIPLIIYDPTRKLPKSFDAQFSTSVDFTPSLAHYLGLNNIDNPFMGYSIFEKQHHNREINKGVASIGNKTFIIDKKSIHKGSPGSFTGPYREDLSKLHNFFSHIHQLEVENRIWKQ